ncbi:hypothetical protein ACFLZV_07125 [Candidatus Margulisiibacteriota bacterium]
MKKFTVYEIEKLTGGKLTKYKLNQAILKGSLKAEIVEGDKKGKGVPKYYILENDLDDYLKRLEQEKKRKIEIPGEEENTGINEELKNTVQELIQQKNQFIQTQTNQIDELKQRISMLETQQSKLTPLLSQEKDSENIQKKEQRLELIMELANTSVFAIKSRNGILKKLSKLA